MAIRLRSTDVTANSVSCYKLAIGVERIETGRIAWMLGCIIQTGRGSDRITKKDTEGEPEQ